MRWPTITEKKRTVVLVCLLIVELGFWYYLTTMTDTAIR
jgi:hypothetical protein